MLSTTSSVLFQFDSIQFNAISVNSLLLAIVID
jgi:hypothetical protein